MGFFDRLHDFGDREVVRTHAMKIDVGLQQIESASDLPIIKGLSYAIKNEVHDMLVSARKLTSESIGCLDVKYRGRKVLFGEFLFIVRKASERIVERGGYPII